MADPPAEPDRARSAPRPPAPPLLAPAETRVKGALLERRYRLAVPPAAPPLCAAAALAWLLHSAAPLVSWDAAAPLLLLAASAVLLFFRRTIEVDRDGGTLALGIRLGRVLARRTIPLASIDAVSLEEERGRPVHVILVRPEEGADLPALRMAGASAARGEAVFLALALRKPLVERLDGEELRHPPESLARPWLEHAVAGSEPEPAPPHRAVAEAPTPGGRLLVVRRRHARPAWAQLCAEGLLAAGAVALVSLRTLRGETLALVLLALALVLYHISETLFGRLILSLTPDTLTIRERFVVERTLYAMRWERLHDIAPVGGRDAALHFVSASGDFALALPEPLARALAARIAAYVREASLAGHAAPPRPGPDEPDPAGPDRAA